MLYDLLLLQTDTDAHGHTFCLNHDLLVQLLLDMQERLLRTEAVLGMGPTASAPQLLDPDPHEDDTDYDTDTDYDSKSDSASESSKSAAPQCNDTVQQHAVPRLRLLPAADSPREASPGQSTFSSASHQQDAAVRQEDDDFTAGPTSGRLSHAQELDMPLSAHDKETQVGTSRQEDQAGIPSSSHAEFTHFRFNAQSDGATTPLTEQTEAFISGQRLQSSTLSPSPSLTPQESTAADQEEVQEQLVARVGGFTQQRDVSTNQTAQLIPAVVQPASSDRTAANAAAMKQPKRRFGNFFRLRPANNRFL